MYGPKMQNLVGVSFQFPILFDVFFNQWTFDCVNANTILQKSTFCMPLSEDDGMRGKLSIT